jgi:thiol-disulfide isomerase/thioredoxin
MIRFLLPILLAASFTIDAAEPTTAPAFTLKDDKGRQISFPRSEEGVDIYLFWASWCPYCKALMPHLQSILEEYGDEVRVFAFNIRDDVDPAITMDKYGFDFHLMPAADELMELYGVKGTPGLFLVDSEGLIRLNLYQLLNQDEVIDKELSNSQKAARKAPWWASEIRQSLDVIQAK